MCFRNLLHRARTGAPVLTLALIGGLVTHVHGQNPAVQGPPAAESEASEPAVAAKPGTVVPPRSATGWYMAAEMDQSLQTARTVGHPVALMLTDPTTTCPSD